MGCCLSTRNKLPEVRMDFPPGDLTMPLIQLDLKQEEITIFKNLTLLVFEEDYPPLIYSIPYKYKSYLIKFDGTVIVFSTEVINNTPKNVLLVYNNTGQVIQRYYSCSTEYFLLRHFENGGEYNQNVDSFEIVDTETSDYLVYIQ